MSYGGPEGISALRFSSGKRQRIALSSMRPSTMTTLSSRSTLRLWRSSSSLGATQSSS
ncbi:hypothetical protein ABKV19_001479, partial [Rosa sericea]